MALPRDFRDTDDDDFDTSRAQAGQGFHGVVGRSLHDVETVLQKPFTVGESCMWSDIGAEDCRERGSF
jgi:hypothetical protein